MTGRQPDAATGSLGAAADAALDPADSGAVEQEEIEDPTGFQEAVAASTTFDRVEARLLDDHPSAAPLDPEDGAVHRLTNASTGAERIRLEIEREGLSLRAYGETLESTTPRVLAVADEQELGYDGPLDLAPLSQSLRFRYYASQGTLLQGDTPADQVAVGLGIDHQNQLEALSESVLQERETSETPPEASVQVLTDDPHTGVEVEFSAAGSRALGPAPVVRYEWVFDTDALSEPLSSPPSGPREDVAAEAGDAGSVATRGTQLRASHVYDDPGIYEVAVVVEDADGNRGLATTIADVDAEEAEDDGSVVAGIGSLSNQGGTQHEALYLESQSTSPADDPIDEWEWTIGGQTATGQTVQVPTEANPGPGGLYVSLTVTTESGATDSTTRELFDNTLTLNTLPANEEIAASISRNTQIQFEAAQLQGVDNSGTDGANDAYTLPTHGPIVVPPGTSIELSAQDTYVPGTPTSTSCTWTVEHLDYGLPIELFDYAREDSQISNAEDPLDPSLDETPYPYSNSPYSGHNYHPFRAGYHAEAELPVPRERETVTGPEESDLDDGFEFEVPEAPEEWALDHTMEYGGDLEFSVEVTGHRPAFLVTLEVQAEYGEYGEDEQLSDTVETLVYLDRTDGAYDGVEATTDPPDDPGQAPEDTRWAIGRPGIAGYAYQAAYSADDSIVTYADGPVVVPTGTEHVDFIYAAGGIVGTPAGYQGFVESEIALRWLTYQPIEWGPPISNTRIFVPVALE